MINLTEIIPYLLFIYLETICATSLDTLLKEVQSKNNTINPFVLV